MAKRLRTRSTTESATPKKEKKSDLSKKLGLGRPIGSTRANTDTTPFTQEEKERIYQDIDRNIDQIKSSLEEARHMAKKYIMHGFKQSGENARRELKVSRVLSSELWGKLKPSTHNPKRFEVKDQDS